MKRVIWWCLMWLWCDDATRRYWGPSPDGVYFNTACFQQAVGKTLGEIPESKLATVWLVSHGWYQGIGGCHWFRTAKAANKHFDQCTKLGIGIKTGDAGEVKE